MGRRLREMETVGSQTADVQEVLYSLVIHLRHVSPQLFKGTRRGRVVESVGGEAIAIVEKLAVEVVILQKARFTNWTEVDSSTNVAGVNFEDWI